MIKGMFTAQEARKITENAPLKRLRITEEMIFSLIKTAAEEGSNGVLIKKEKYPVDSDRWDFICRRLEQFGYQILPAKENKHEQFFIKW